MTQTITVPTTFMTGVFGIPVERDKISSQLKYLLTQRHEPEKTSHLKWQFAGGGMEYGETAEQTLVREMQEEVSLTPRILFPFPLLASSTWEVGSYDEKRYHIHLVCFIVSIDAQKIELTEQNRTETADWKWYTLEEAATLDTMPNVKEVLQKASQVIEQYELV